MSLPSQTARTSPAGRSFVYRRRRNRKMPPPIVLAGGGVAVVVLIVGGVLLFSDVLGKPSSAEAAEGPASGGGLEPGASEPVVTEPLASAGRRDGLSAVERRAPAEPARDGLVLSNGPGAERPTETSSGARIPPPPPMEKSRGMLAEAVGSGEGGSAETPVSKPVNRPESRPAATPASDPGARPDSKIAPHLEAADQMMKVNDPLAARQALWDAMGVPGLNETERRVLRERLSALNEAIVFEGPYRPGDRLSETYTVQPGDALSRIARAQGLGTHWRLIQRVNGLASPNLIRAGQTLKLVRGPFHAVVDKSDYRLDLYHGPTEQPDEWVYVRSFDVGLGEGDSTPIGHFIVRTDGKLENPGWVNPRDGSEKYTPDDPENPIGEFWIGLDGLGDSSVHTGYGIHGTIEPETIGRMESMGCVRLRPDDIALLFELMAEGESLVRIRR